MRKMQRRRSTIRMRQTPKRKFIPNISMRETVRKIVSNSNTVREIIR
jgi:hypothetical protein